MALTRFHLQNYKSYEDSGEVELRSGLNIIVGANSAGKTALLEGIRLHIAHVPHRSLATVPTRQSAPKPESSVTAVISFSSEELSTVIQRLGGHIHWPTSSDHESSVTLLRKYLARPFQVFTRWAGGALQSAYFIGYDFPSTHTQATLFSVNHDNGSLTPVGNQHVNAARNHMLDYVLAQHVASHQLYLFQAERPRLGASARGIGVDLASDASNLAEVLHNLQSTSPYRWGKYKSIVREIFPEIHEITVVPTRDDRVEVHVWPVEAHIDREDLASSLSASGTGLGQVMAMLYVVLNSDGPRIILIDEPQSFLHPGAIRKLLQIFGIHRQHQYVITTHSPTALVAADPATILLVRKVGFVSSVTSIDPKSKTGLEAILAEVGVRLSDVFGADSILWVEGLTEEKCFVQILTELRGLPPLGTVVLGLINTGDLEGKRAEVALRIYEKLSAGQALLPPAKAFVFDGDKKGKVRIGSGTTGLVHFLPVQNYESYLLNPRAIASLAAGIPGFSNSGAISVDEVSAWIERFRWDPRYFAKQIAQQEQNLESWSSTVNGAAMIEDLFLNLSGSRVAYQKAAFGEALTRWLIDNSPEDLAFVANWLGDRLSP